MELFSSEGCSSCPPADAYLAELARAQPVEGATILALEQHVDYWDDLGWPDPFAHPRFTARQRQYASALTDGRMFTPEIVVDGHSVVDSSQAVSAIRKASREPRARTVLTKRNGNIDVDVSAVPPGDEPAEVWLAVTESGLSSRVPRGENAGRVLSHAPIVRDLRKLGTVSNGAFHAEVPTPASASWKPAAVHFVAFVQRAKSRRIVGAGTI